MQEVVQDTMHQLTTGLAKNHGVLVVEDLAVRNLTRIYGILFSA